MKKLFYNAPILVLFAVLMASCGDTSFLGQAKKGISSKDYQATLTAVDSVLATDPGNAEAYYLRAVAYGEIATQNPVVANRKSDYEKMHEALEKTEEVSGGNVNIFQLQADELIRRKWGYEHNLAVQYAVGDTAVAPVNNPLQRSIEHLQNAIAANPDSSLSYEVLAEVYRMNDDYSGAVTALRAAMDRKGQPTASDYNNLASFYMVLEDYPDAVTVLEEGLKIYPDSVDLVQKIADSYMNIGENDKAIATLENLIRNEPNNAQYHLVLGTQLYIISSDISDKISANYDQIFDAERVVKNLRGAEKEATEQRINTLKNEIASMMAETEKLTDRAISELNTVTRLKPNDATTFNTLGIVYQNQAASLFKQRDATTDNDAAAVLDGQARAELDKAMQNYEKAAAIEPENKDFWNSLFRVYTALGMNDKAEEAMKKAGM